MLHNFSVLPTPEAFIKQLNTIIYNFLWKGPDKVARPPVINDLKYGGLNLMGLETSIKSLRLAWLGRLFVERSSPWKAFVQPRSQGLFPGLGAGREKSAGHVPTLHPEILGVIN